MRPAIRAGDLLITRAEPATEIHVGEVVTFDDPGLERKARDPQSRRDRCGRPADRLPHPGDANATPESWSVDRHASVGTLHLRIAGAGRAVAWLADPWARTILLTLAALVLSTAMLRRIWRA